MADKREDYYSDNEPEWPVTDEQAAQIRGEQYTPYVYPPLTEKTNDTGKPERVLGPDNELLADWEKDLLKQAPYVEQKEVDAVAKQLFPDWDEWTEPTKFRRREMVLELLVAAHRVGWRKP